jgi:hypothetical protein
MQSRIRPVAFVVLAMAALACSPGTGPSDPTDAAAPVGPPTACLSLGPVDCERALVAATAMLAPDHPPLRYAQVGPFYCPVMEGCPTTLVARPEGEVAMEFAQGPSVQVRLKTLVDGSISAAVVEATTFAVDPSSGPSGPGAVPYTLGHCGLWSGIDVDGSFWDPVGQVDADHTDAINSADGTFTFIGPDQATFVSAGGLVVQLIRHDGPKGLPGCM